MELAVCKKQRGINKKASAKPEGGMKSKRVYMEGCVLILHFFIVENIPSPRSDLITFTSPKMLT